MSRIRYFSSHASVTELSSTKLTAGLTAGWREACDQFATATDDHFLALLHEIQQLPELVLRLKGAEFPHRLPQLI